MTTKKVLLMVGLLAAVGLAYWAFNGTPVEDGEEGAIGAANRYRAEQINDSDVNLENEDVITLLQDDVFLDLIQDEEFQTLMAREDAAAALARHGVYGLYRGAKPSAILAERDVIALARLQGLEAALQHAEVVAAFDKQMKIEPVDEGKKESGPQYDIAMAKIANLDALQKNLTVIFERNNLKFEDVGDGGKKGQGHLKGSHVAGLMARPMAVQAITNKTLKPMLLEKQYVAFARSQNVALAKSQNVAGWSQREVALLGAVPNVAALNKNFKPEYGRSSDVALWQKNADVLMKSGIAQGLLNQRAMVFFARADVQAAMRPMVEAGAFNKQNIGTTLDRFKVASPR